MKYKLVSPKDTLLGHIDVPNHWEYYFKKNGHFTTFIMPDMSKFAFSNEVLPAAEIIADRITLIDAYWSQYEKAVCIVEGKIEDLEKLPNCSFSPSMAYIKSLMS